MQIIICCDSFKEALIFGASRIFYRLYKTQRITTVAVKKGPPAIPADTTNQKDDVWLTVNESLESFFDPSAT